MTRLFFTVPERATAWQTHGRMKAVRPANWKRLAVATAVLHLGLAIVVVIAFEVVLPAMGGASTPSSSGFNYGAIFGSGLRPLGWILAAALIVLAPVNFAMRLLVPSRGNRRR